MKPAPELAESWEVAQQPYRDVAMPKAVSGYQFWFHREPDYRQFVKG